MVVLAKLIPWDALEEEFWVMHINIRAFGQAPKPLKLMALVDALLMMLKYMHSLSDEEVVRSWV